MANLSNQQKHKRDPATFLELEIQRFASDQFQRPKATSLGRLAVPRYRRVTDLRSDIRSNSFLRLLALIRR